MSASPYVPPSRSGAIPTGRFRQNHNLGIAASVAVGVVVPASAFTSYTDLHLAAAVRDYAYTGGDVAALNDADRLSRLGSLANLVLFLVAGVLVIVWLWRARANAQFFCDAPHRHRRGWVIGGWMVPIISLWFPVQVVDDVVRASSPYVWPRDGSLQAAPPAKVVRRWWGTYLGMNLTSLFATTQQSNGLAAPSASAALRGLDTGASLSIVSTVLAVLSAIFMIQLIALVDRLQSSRPPIPWWQTPLNPPVPGPAPW
ncbi:uncharacterized protein DUF4328 [Kribbella pratensis]|uniref:Uncharacterized protein DUF4328 n=1 Tax=Kribbella pratensis TaxID=2512112 RepID=A0ABY2FGE3_9ACTN|nr:DUF4328 domain-containing protein [Kribbella pratensis]TDW90440.1 uncharacterized protein DUF4328 [Kribbella pratensis]